MPKITPPPGQKRDEITYAFMRGQLRPAARSGAGNAATRPLEMTREEFLQRLKGSHGRKGTKDVLH